MPWVHIKCAFPEYAICMHKNAFSSSISQIFGCSYLISKPLLGHRVFQCCKNHKITFKNSGALHPNLLVQQVLQAPSNSILNTTLGQLDSSNVMGLYASESRETTLMKHLQQMLLLLHQTHKTGPVATICTVFAKKNGIK